MNKTTILTLATILAAACGPLDTTATSPGPLDTSTTTASTTATATTADDSTGGDADSSTAGSTGGDADGDSSGSDAGDAGASDSASTGADAPGTSTGYASTTTADGTTSAPGGSSTTGDPGTSTGSTGPVGGDESTGGEASTTGPNTGASAPLCFGDPCDADLDLCAKGLICAHSPATWLATCVSPGPCELGLPCVIEAGQCGDAPLTECRLDLDNNEARCFAVACDDDTPCSVGVCDDGRCYLI